jgi:hypothetical protein
MVAKWLVNRHGSRTMMGVTACRIRSSPPGILGRSPDDRATSGAPGSADPEPDSGQRAAPAVALPAAPMPLGLGIARPPTLRARSRDVATACLAGRGAHGPRRGARKVAQSGMFSAFFRASVHMVYTGAVRGATSVVDRLSSAIVPSWVRSRSSGKRDCGLSQSTTWSPTAVGIESQLGH